MATKTSVITKRVGTTKDLANEVKSFRKAFCGKRLGDGLFAVVYNNKHKPDEAIRISKTDGEGYFRWADYVGLNATNPHFPKIKSVTMIRSKAKAKLDSYGEVVEPNFTAIVVLEKLVNYFEVPHEERQKALEAVGITDVEEMGDLGCGWTPTTPASKALKRALKKTNGFDIHEGNVLFRKTKTGYEMVVTDPCV